MLVACSNSDCSIQFSDTASGCPVCGALPGDRAPLEVVPVRIDPDRAELGRKLLLSAFALQIVLNLVLIVLLRNLGMELRSNTAIIRLLIELGLMIAIYKGGEIIRTFWVFSASLGAVMAFAAFVGSGRPALLLFVLFSLYSIYVVRLSPSVSAFLHRQDSANGDS